MKLILDISINHTGIAHKWFNRDGEFFDKSVGAYNNPDSPERAYYFLNPDNTYHKWLGVDTLPTLNYTSEAAEASGEVTPEKEKEETAALGNGSMAVGERPFLMGADAGRKESDVVPCVESYTVEPDLSNVDNLWQFYLEEGMAEKLSENGFVVSGFAGNEFFEIYETNRYSMVPNFIGDGLRDLLDPKLRKQF